MPFLIFGAWGEGVDICPDGGISGGLVLVLVWGTCFFSFICIFFCFSEAKDSFSSFFLGRISYRDGFFGRLAFKVMIA